MEIQRYGIILNTERFDECAAFYEQVFGLKIMFKKHEAEGFRLICFELGSSYLMIETGGKSSAEPKGVAECPSALRFNVKDIESTQLELNALGIDAEVETYDWGRIIRLSDPDGNRISIRDEEGFLHQMAER